MINSDITAIGSPYVHSNNGGNQTDYTDNLSAQMWNNLSQAVETAHTKINSIVGGTNATISGANVNIESSDGNVTIASDSDLSLGAGNGIQVTSSAGNLILSGYGNTEIICGSSDITFSLGSNSGESCTLSDILTVVNYFKTNNGSGPFAAAA